MNENQTTPIQPDGTRSDRTLIRRRRSKKQSILYLTELALLVAITMVLHFTGAAIPAFGTKFSLVLIPIALGAMVLGPTAGAILGFVYGVTVYVSFGVLHLDPFTGFLFDNHPIIAALICIIKTTAAGFVAGWVYRWLRKLNEWVAVFAAAILVPTVNTSVFVAGCFCILNTINQYVATDPKATYSGVYFILAICAGLNYPPELAANIVFAPALERIIRLVSKKLTR